MRQPIPLHAACPFFHTEYGVGCPLLQFADGSDGYLPETRRRVSLSWQAPPRSGKLDEKNYVLSYIPASG